MVRFIKLYCFLKEKEREGGRKIDLPQVRSLFKTFVEMFQVLPKCTLYNFTLEESLKLFRNWGWHEKAFFAENARRGWCKEAPLNQYVRRGCHAKDQFIENARRDWYGISFFYSIRVQLVLL